jgi:hypothetical protein
LPYSDKELQRVDRIKNNIRRKDEPQKPLQLPVKDTNAEKSTKPMGMDLCGEQMGDSPAAVHDDFISKYGKQMEREKIELLFSLHNEKVKHLNSFSEKNLKKVANQDTLFREKMLAHSVPSTKKEKIYSIKKSQVKNNWYNVKGSDFCLFVWILIFVYYTMPRLIPLTIGLCCFLNRCFKMQKICEDSCNYVNEKIEWGMRRYLNLNESPAVQVVFTNNMLKKVEKRDQPESPVIHYEPKDGLADLSTNKLSLELLENLTLAPCDVRRVTLAEGTSEKADTVFSVSPIYQDDRYLKTSVKIS